MATSARAASKAVPQLSQAFVKQHPELASLQKGFFRKNPDAALILNMQSQLFPERRVDEAEFFAQLKKTEEFKKARIEGLKEAKEAAMPEYFDRKDALWKLRTGQMRAQKESCM